MREPVSPCDVDTPKIEEDVLGGDVEFFLSSWCIGSFEGAAGLWDLQAP